MLEQTRHKISIAPNSSSAARPCNLMASGLLIIALLLSACGQTAPQTLPTQPPPTSTAIPSGGGTLRILSPEAPTILNPHLAVANKDREACRITYEPLASFDKTGKLVPFLAAEIPSLENGELAADYTSVTWKIKPNIKWSDGEPFTADDVKFTYEFVSNPDVKAAYVSTYSSIASVEVLDAHTVKINFKTPAPDPAWALPFVGFQGMIIPRHVFAAYNGSNALEAPANTLPVGTGPYRVMPPGIKPQEVLLLGTQLIQTNKIVFEPNPYFREPNQPFYRIELKGGGTASEAARLVLQDGSIDYALALQTLSPEDLASLTTEKGQLVTNFGTAVERISLNFTDPNKETADGERSSTQFAHPFFSDKRVRQAFAYAINRDPIVALYGPIGRPTNNNLVAPPQYNSPDTFYTYDPAKAAALLDEAGWRDTDGDGVREKDGVKLKVVYQAYIAPVVQKVQQLVSENLKAVGVDVELKIVDSSVMFGKADVPGSIWTFNADIEEFTRRSLSPDPSTFMRDWTCANIPQKANAWTGLNVERRCNSDYDALYQRAITELDPEKRRQIFIQMNDMLIEDVVMIPLVYTAEAAAASRTLAGVDLTPWDANTWNIKDWRRITP